MNKRTQIESDKIPGIFEAAGFSYPVDLYWLAQFAMTRALSWREHWGSRDYTKVRQGILLSYEDDIVRTANVFASLNENDRSSLFEQGAQSSLLTMGQLGVFSRRTRNTILILNQKIERKEIRLDPDSKLFKTWPSASVLLDPKFPCLAQVFSNGGTEIMRELISVGLVLAHSRLSEGGLASPLLPAADTPLDIKGSQFGL